MRLRHLISKINVDGGLPDQIDTNDRYADSRGFVVVFKNGEMRAVLGRRSEPTQLVTLYSGSPLTEQAMYNLEASNVLVRLKPIGRN